MNEFEERIEKLQNLSHEEKIKIMWIGVPIVMIAVIFVWLSFTDFSFKKDINNNSSEEISKLQILKNGFAVTIKDARNLFNNFKDQINQSYSFEIKSVEQNNSNDLAGTSTIQMNEVLENKVATTTR
ncbi:MAG: hypothetical protein ACYC3G_00260 [Minisyncoccota bacterium]